MIGHLRRHWVAYIALGWCVGGTAYAATVLPKNSVGARQLRAGAVTEPKIKPGSLSAAVFAPGALVQGNSSVRIQVSGFQPSVPASPTFSSFAACQQNERVVGGGFDLGQNETATVLRSSPINPNSWVVTARFPDDYIGGGIVYALCLS